MTIQVATHLLLNGPALRKKIAQRTAFRRQRPHGKYLILGVRCLIHGKHQHEQPELYDVSSSHRAPPFNNMWFSESHCSRASKLYTGGWQKGLATNMATTDREANCWARTREEVSLRLN